MGSQWRTGTGLVALAAATLVAGAVWGIGVAPAAAGDRGLAAVNVGPAAGRPVRVAYVTESLLNRVAEVSLSSGRVIRFLAVGRGPEAITSTVNGKWLAVADFGVASVQGAATSLVDTTTARVTNVRTGGKPGDVAMAPDMRSVWVVDNQHGTLEQISLRRRRVTDTIHLGGHPRALVISPDGATAYVADMGTYDRPDGHVVERIDLRRGTITGRVWVGTEPCAEVLSPNGATLWVSVDGGIDYRGRGKVVAIRTSTMKVDRSTTVGFGPAGMALSANGRTLYVTNAGTDYLDNRASASSSYPSLASASVSVIGLPAGTVERTIAAGLGPWTLALSANGHQAWVVDARANGVTPIDLATGHHSPLVAVTGHPHGITLAGPLG